MMTVVCAPTYEQARQYANKRPLLADEWRYGGEARLVLSITSSHRKGRILWYEGDMSWHDDPARLSALEAEVAFAMIRGWTYEEVG